jgi:hypothetical protein
MAMAHFCLSSRQILGGSMDPLSTLRIKQEITAAESSILMNPIERWLSIFFPPRVRPVLKDDLPTVISYQRRLERGSKARIFPVHAA